MNSKFLIAVALLSLSGCTTTSTPDASTRDASMSPDSPGPMFDPALCRPTVVQPDFVSQGAMGESIPGTVWFGPAVNPATGQPTIPPGSLVATTYLQLRIDPASQMTFGDVAGRVFGALFASPGLIAVATVASNQCAAARTLTVWESEEAMMGFVTSAAHAEAMARVGEMSRGGSVTTTFMANASGDVSWAEVVRRFEGHTGPIY
jgi:heme-degrading monooxygenase HmoA